MLPEPRDDPHRPPLHTTSVWSNRPPFGAWAGFKASGAEAATVAVSLQAAGYRTGFVGKYLNSYRGAEVPPGWDAWRAFTYGWGFYDYTLNVDGRLVRYGSAPSDYSTDVLARMAERFIRRSREPFFLFFSPAAPHSPAVPAPRHADVELDLPPFSPPSRRERDLDDKPAYVRRSAAPLTWAQQRFREKQYRSLLAVDDALGRLLDALEATGELRDTIFVFTSDNGVLWGEHGFPAARKSVPYESSIRVPLVVRYDALIEGARREERLVTNLDLAPTFAELAGAWHRTEGLSLVSLLVGEDAPWRRSFLVENMGGETPEARIPTYCGLRTARYLYALYRTGEEELYDLHTDPYQLENVARDETRAETVEILRRELRRRCFPLPPGFHPALLCTLLGTARDDRLFGSRHGDYACPRGGRDTVATGAGADTVDASARTVRDLHRATYGWAGGGAPGSSISTGAGADRVSARNRRRDRIRCGAGRDVVLADGFDAVAADCERVGRPR